MSPFSVEVFIQQAKDAMSTTDHVDEKQKRLRALIQSTVKEHSTQEMVDALTAAVPPGASLGEMIIFADDELTLLYAQVPPHFASAIHNHTIFACITPLVGAERNTFFTLQQDGTLLQDQEHVVGPKETIELAPDVIHCIANDSDEPLLALHCYGGNFKALDEQRDLWDFASYARCHATVHWPYGRRKQQGWARGSCQGNPQTTAAIPGSYEKVGQVAIDLLCSAIYSL